MREVGMGWKGFGGMGHNEGEEIADLPIGKRDPISHLTAILTISFLILFIFLP